MATRQPLAHATAGESVHAAAAHHLVTHIAAAIKLALATCGARKSDKHIAQTRRAREPQLEVGLYVWPVPVGGTDGLVGPARMLLRRD